MAKARGRLDTPADAFTKSFLFTVAYVGLRQEGRAKSTQIRILGSGGPPVSCRDVS